MLTKYISVKTILYALANILVIEAHSLFLIYHSNNKKFDQVKMDATSYMQASLITLQPIL